MSDTGEEEDDEVEGTPGVEEWIADESRAKRSTTGLRPRSSAATAGAIRRSRTRAPAIFGVVTGYLSVSSPRAVPRRSP
jgi:hypothetical protein